MTPNGTLSPSQRPDLDRALDVARQDGTEGFTNLYRMLAGDVAAFCRARGARDVDDVVNDIFLGAFRGLARFRGDGAAFRAYVYRIARNKIYDQRHSLRIARERLTDGPVPEQPVDDHDGTEALALSRLDSGLVNELLAPLTEDQREVILLRFLSELTVPEVAAATDRAESAVKALQRRAVATLRRRNSPLGSIAERSFTDSCS